MYRVELKGNIVLSLSSLGSVPNVPCGVESLWRSGRNKTKMGVFLMYRVELKVAYYLRSLYREPLWVPNVPCGVESDEAERRIAKEVCS